MPAKLPTIPVESVPARLQRELPGWVFEEGWIRRTFNTAGWPVTLMLVNAIAFLSEAAWHHPDLEVSHRAVGVKLRTHEAGGITERDLALAREIDRLALWRPSHGSALEGTPGRWISAGRS